jgi:hypothetical protein
MIQIILTLLIAFGVAMTFSDKKPIREYFMPPLSYRFEEGGPKTMLDSTTVDYSVDRPQTEQPQRAEYARADLTTRPETVRSPPHTSLFLNYTAPPNQTSNVAPRVADVYYGAYINERPPDQRHLAVEPFNPLGLSQNGQLQPIIYARAVYANKKSRLNQLGDPIRGDIPIAPLSGDAWFKPAVTPHIDLREGAMTVMGGRHNDTTNELGLLKYNSTYGAHNIIAGSPFKPDNEMVMQTSGMIPLYKEMVNNVGDVTVTTMY